jgi:hypothetical protein
VEEEWYGYIEIGWGHDPEETNRCENSVNNTATLGRKKLEITVVVSKCTGSRENPQETANENSGHLKGLFRWWNEW